MPRKPSFAAAVRAGGLDALEVIRDQIARDLEGCESFRDRAALYLRLVDVLGRVEQARAAAVPASGDAVDQLKLRRARRFPVGTSPRTNLLGD